MDEKQDAAEKQANAADDDVSVAEERIFAAENRRCWEDERLGAVELRDGVIWKDSGWASIKFYCF